jgi:anti-anti-sigma regulatory factor
VGKPLRVSPTGTVFGGFRQWEVNVVNAGATRHVRQVRLGDHLCLPFATDDEQREVVAAFMVDGLARGERVLYFADRTEPEMIDSWIADRGVDPHRARADGRLDVRRLDHHYLVGGRFEPEVVITTLWVEVRQTRDAGYPGLRVTGEMTSDARPVADTSRLHEYESRFANAFSSRELAAICQYDERVFDPATMTGLVACHPEVVRIDPVHDDRRLRIVRSFNPTGLRVIGVVDVVTSGALASSLDLAASWTDGDVHLDLAHLDFVDVAGVRSIVRTAAALAPDRRLVVSNLAAGLRRVFGVVGWDRTPGLHVAETDRP